MRLRTLIIIAASVLATCGGEPEKNPEALKLQRDTFASALAIQLNAVNYKADITNEGETVNIRVGQTPLSDVRRAICRQIGWPSAEGKMIRLADTLRLLREAGATKVKVIGDSETLDVELGQDGRCLKSL